MTGCFAAAKGYVYSVGLMGPHFKTPPEKVKALVDDMAKGAVETLRREGVRVGLFRPLTLWPFPTAALKSFLPNARRILVVEASNGQLEDELRLALSKAGVVPPPIESIRHSGGILPQTAEIAAAVRASQEVLA